MASASMQHITDFTECADVVFGQRIAAGDEGGSVEEHRGRKTTYRPRKSRPRLSRFATKSSTPARVTLRVGHPVVETRHQLRFGNRGQLVETFCTDRSRWHRPVMLGVERGSLARVPYQRLQASACLAATAAGPLRVDRQTSQATRSAVSSRDPESCIVTPTSPSSPHPRWRYVDAEEPKGPGRGSP